MANHPRLEDFDLSSLRYIMWGATPVAEEVARTVTRRSGVRWLPAYGTSEVPVIAANPVQDPERWRLDSAGLAVPGVEIRITDPETGAVLDAGATGEIEVRSPSAMAGLPPRLRDRSRRSTTAGTAPATSAGWSREGWLHITDRLKEMIKVRGFQVAPAEIEAVLHADPRVRDCAVFGVDDAELGEAIVAAVVLVPGRAVAPEELQAVGRRAARGLQAHPPRRDGRRDPAAAVGEGAAPPAQGALAAGDLTTARSLRAGIPGSLTLAHGRRGRAGLPSRPCPPAFTGRSSTISTARGTL